MKNFQHEQLFTENFLFEEISDDKSASLTGGARANFSGRIPSVGSVTLPGVYRTTSEFNDISIRMTNNPYALTVKAVRPNGGGDVSSYTRNIPANSRGLITVAAGVKDGTPFQLNFSAPTINSFNIAGRMTY